MSLDVYLEVTKPTTIFEANITHNLNRMAQAAGIYEALWCPDEIGITKAAQLIEPLAIGLKLLQNNPEQFKKYNPENGWGNYGCLVDFVRGYLHACVETPDADVAVRDCKEITCAF